MAPRTCLRLGFLLPAIALVMSGCGEKIPLQPVNHSPVVQSLTVFPTTIGMGDSAVIICVATDADGDTVVFDWYSYGLVDLKGKKPWGGNELYNKGGTMVVYPNSGARAPLDTTWVACEARDGRGGFASAGRVQIFIQQ